MKVAVIEPGYFKTGLTRNGRIAQGIQEAWDHASPEVKEIYGEKFPASREWAVDCGGRSTPLSGTLGPSLAPS